MASHIRIENLSAVIEDSILPQVRREIQESLEGEVQKTLERLNGVLMASVVRTMAGLRLIVQRLPHLDGIEIAVVAELVEPQEKSDAV